MLRVVQLKQGSHRAVAVVDEPYLKFLAEFDSIYALAEAAVKTGISMSSLVEGNVTSWKIGYDDVYSGKSEWTILPPIDHPAEPARCMVSGTGLTHLGSAKNRQEMHSVTETELTDSMRMFRAGVERGRPAPGEIGAAPEWFYKGNGTILRASGEPLNVPFYASDGGEEAEIAGIYLIAPDGAPRRIGFVVGNEFSDHVLEKTNYLNLASSKLRNCSIGPELVIGAEFNQILGNVLIERGGQTVWAKEIATGEAEMCHSLANIEHHHFKFEAHRRPGDIHVHYFGANSLSFGAGVRLLDGDVMSISFTGFGRPLRNSLKVSVERPQPILVTSLL